MTIRDLDILLRASKVMADVPEGGGGPSSKVIRYGESNTIFDDVSTPDFTLGNASIRQLHAHVDTPDTDRLLGAYALVSELPDNPNISVVLAKCDTFARRTEIASAVANYLIASVPWNGFLLSNHVKDQGQIEICQRVGTPAPNKGRTLVLVRDEGLPTEVSEYVRVADTSEEVRTGTDAQGDYQYLAVRCTLTSKLKAAWPGTDPSRTFTIGTGKTRIRDTSAANAGEYYGASPLTVAYALASQSRKIKTNSLFGQLIPSSSTDTAVGDRRAAAQREITLATAPRAVTVSGAPHTARVRVTQESRTTEISRALRPIAEPGTITITYVVLGTRYTITDTGVASGGLVPLTGDGAGTYNVTTGTLLISLSALPDVGSAIVITWGERLPYTNRSSMGAQVRAPEYVIPLVGDGAAIAASIVIKFPSESVIRTATVNAAGVISGDATGNVDAIGKKAYIKPKFMVDTGGEFEIEYQLDSVVTDILDAPAVDGTGTGLLTLTQVPVAGTVQVTWATGQETTVASGQYVQRMETVVEQNTQVVIDVREQSDFEATLQTVFPPGPAQQWSSYTNWPRSS